MYFKYTCLFGCNRGDTIQYHSGLRSRELGQAPGIPNSLSGIIISPASIDGIAVVKWTLSQIRDLTELKDKEQHRRT